MPIDAGKLAPDFSLLDETKTERTLSEFRGSPVVLYFYPRDDTPGCTKEACNFRDDYSAYQKNGIKIVGVSPDTSEKHTKFKEKYDLPFTLLADEEHKVAELFGVWVKKKSFGREYFGIARTTFLIDAEGKIINVFKNVKPAVHSKQVLEALQIS